MLGLDHNPVIAPVASLAPEAQAPPLPAGSLQAEAVPPAQKDQPVPLVRVLIPVVMMVAVGTVMALMVLSGRGVSPMMLIFPLMMAVGMLAMFNPSEGKSDIDETRRIYLRHLDALAARARRNAEQQREHFTYLHPAAGELVAGVGTERVWERLPGTASALQVRVGTGATALATPVQVDDPGSPEDLDPVCAVSLRRTVAAVSSVQGMPIVVQLAAFPSVTLVGPRAAEVARGIVCQLAFFHGPEIVGIDAARTEFAWTKWLPHARTPETAQFRVLFIDASMAAPILADNVDCVITIHPDPDYFVDDNALHLVCADTITAHTSSGSEYLGEPDPFAAAEAELVARRLAFYRRPEEAADGTRGDVLSILGLDRLDDATEASALWPGREGTRQRLTVPIGATPEGNAVYLDLKEAAHGGAGPHGLCIGATGSGKSELLRTLVVALAATHSPDELNLVLVDFKGGATFLGCEGLPHTSAVITNLEDEAVLVERMYDALSGEMHRRQELLRKAGNYANITDYTAARMGGAELDPLPALIVVVDEFSELLSQHPNFADLFVAIGRLGRSLGVHLLLASQRLEEGKLRGLDSHLSYRIGLKTFSAAESRQVLGVPDAYELPGEPGSGYLKAASPELTRFRAAYVSGPRTRTVVTRRDAQPIPVRVFAGWSDEQRALDALDAAQATETVVADGSGTLLDAVVAKTSELAQRAGMRAHQVWLDPLPEVLELHALRPDEYRGEFLCVPVGLVDEPYLQRQDTLVLDLGASGGHLAIAGAPQTGKSEAAKTLVASLALTHTTDQLAVYAVDAGSGGLADLEVLPHVAGTATKNDEEKARRVVDEVLGLLDTQPARHTLLIIDGWHTLLSPDSKLEDLREALTRIASEGPAAGVHLILTTQRWSAVRSNVRDLVGTRLELKLTEPMDSLVDRKAQASLPTRPGVGLTPDGKVMVVARTSAEDLAHIAQTTAGQTPVPALKVLPQHVSAHLLIDGQPHHLPLGIGGPRLDPLRCVSGHVLAIGSSGCGKSTFIASAISAIEAMPREQARMVILDPRRAHLGRASDDMVAFYAASSTAITDAVKALCATLSSRLPGADVSPQQLAERSWWEGPEIYLVIDDYDLVGDAVLRDAAELLPHARDIGLRVVVARKFGGVSRALFGGFLGALKDLHPDVLVMDGTRDEGNLFGVRPGPLAPGRATLVQAGEVVGPVQVAAPYNAGETL